MMAEDGNDVDELRIAYGVLRKLTMESIEGKASIAFHILSAACELVHQNLLDEEYPRNGLGAGTGAGENPSTRKTTAQEARTGDETSG